MTPCKNPAQWLPDGYAYAYCDTSELNPSKEQCEAVPGCKEEHGWCNCKSKCACELLGGHYWGVTCQEERNYWYPGVHKAVKEAIDKQTCDGVQGPWGDIKYSVDMIGHACCASQKSLCEELDNYDSVYSTMY